MRPLLLMMLSGCTFPSDLPFRTLDYVIDAPRVVSVRIQPLAPRPGDTLQIDALVLSPSEVEQVDLSVCGLLEDMPVSVSASCFSNPDYVEPIGQGLPSTWQVPDLAEPTDICARGGGCTSRVPIRVEASTADGPAYGLEWIEVWFREPTEDDDLTAPYPTPAVTLTALDSPAAGGLVQLIAETDRGWTEDFRWFIDAGELTETGRTRKQDFEAGSSWSANALIIPEDYHGPLRVSVVVAEYWDYNRQPMGWTTLTLEVP